MSIAKSTFSYFFSIVSRLWKVTIHKSIVRWRHLSQLKNDSFCLTNKKIWFVQNATDYHTGPVVPCSTVRNFIVLITERVSSLESLQSHGEFFRYGKSFRTTFNILSAYKAPLHAKVLLGPLNFFCTILLSKKHYSRH